MMKAILILPLLPLLALAGCSAVGPDYKAPSGNLTATYKTVGLSKTPAVGSWWSAFSDSTLNNLLTRAEKNSPSTRIALARLDQSRAMLRIKRADTLPSLSANALWGRELESGNDRFPPLGGSFERYVSTLNLSYEIDFWGRVRRGVAQEQALAEAAAADYETAVLSTKAEVTRNYISLRSLDDENRLLNKTLKLRKENETLVQARVTEGSTTAIDSSRATTETETVRAEIYRLKQRRDELENAIGVLVGDNPSTFRLSPASVPRTPAVPSGVPADLLRRRADVLASERRLAASSEAIGVTIGNYLPRVTLNATGGYAALSSSDLFNGGSRLWNIGPSVSLPVITAGRRKNDEARAKAVYRENLELHRQTVLVAVQDVENALSGIYNLNRAIIAQKKSADAAQEASRLIKLRYDAGLVGFFEFIDAQRQLLNEQRALVQTRSAHQLATVQLIQALGGGWKY
jgi:multidrug efflux system outer membrane protein